MIKRSRKVCFSNIPGGIIGSLGILSRSAQQNAAQQKKDQEKRLSWSNHSRLSSWITYKAQPGMSLYFSGLFDFHRLFGVSWLFDLCHNILPVQDQVQDDAQQGNGHQARNCKGANS